MAQVEIDAQRLSEAGFALVGMAPGRGVVVGNDLTLWPAFVGRYHADAALRALAHPFDAFVEAILTELYPEAAWRYAHRPYDGAYLPIAQWAVQAGLGELGPCQLLINPRVGPWCALRAIAVNASLTAPTSTDAPTSCGNCAQPCMPAFTAACRAPSDDWQAWLAVRTACPVGQAFAYSATQRLYHYTKDKHAIG